MKQNFIYKLITYVDDAIVDNIFETIDEKDWYVDDYRQTAAGMSSTNSIPIFHTPLCATNGSFRAFETVQKNQLYDKYISKITPVLNILKTFYKFNYYTAFISRLSPFSNIDIHPDRGMFLENCNRIHLPIYTNREVYYYIEGKYFNWLKGCLYEFDNSLLHGVFNKSNDFRIHLVINLYEIPEHLLNQLQFDDYLIQKNNEAYNHSTRMECR